MESADRESRRLDILSVKKEANLSAREVGEVEVGKGDAECSEPWPLPASEPSEQAKRYVNNSR